METTVIKIEGTHCNACKALIEDVCGEIVGIKSCDVNFKTGEVKIEHNKNIDWNLLKKEIEGSGEYKVKLNINN